MLKNITFSAEEVLIIKAREKAQSQQTTLNNLFREWLKSLVDKNQSDLQTFIKNTAYAKPGKQCSRDEMNAR